MSSSVEAGAGSGLGPSTVSASAASTVPSSLTRAPSSASKVFFEMFDEDVMAVFDGQLHKPSSGASGGGDGGIGFTASLVSCDAAGWPVSALLGPAEVLAIDRRRLMLALWPASRANRHLASTRQASLDFVAAARFYQLRLRLERSDDVGGLVLHRMVLVEGEAQTVPYASLTSGIRYTLEQQDDTLGRWRDQVALMREIGTKA